MEQRTHLKHVMADEELREMVQTITGMTGDDIEARARACARGWPLGQSEPALFCTTHDPMPLHLGDGRGPEVQTPSPRYPDDGHPSWRLTGSTCCTTGTEILFFWFWTR